jgi:hypothetical protein
MQSNPKQKGSHRGSRLSRSGGSSSTSAGVFSSSSAAICFSLSWLFIAKNDTYIYIYILQLKSAKIKCFVRFEKAIITKKLNQKSHISVLGSKICSQK